MSETDRAPIAQVGGITPILRVESIETSLAYYIGKLGFKIDWQTPAFVSVTRGRSCIFLSQGDQGHVGGWVWIGVDDADVLLDEYRRTDAKIRHLPTNYPWAYEMQVEDLDGNVLRFGSDSLPGQPVGEWLDMRGDKWIKSSGDEWVRAESPRRID